ncbi:MAG TPA: hypothetical protein QF764_15060 [Planctomycetota bacterium]|nr:hypothetical protein [Planctomycetota bacterium]
MDSIPELPATQASPRTAGRPMNLMRLAALQAAVDQALLEGIDLHDRSDGPAWKRSLREHVRERLPILLREQGRLVRGMARSDVVAEMGEQLRVAREDRDRLAGELEELTHKLAHLRRTGAIQRRAIARALANGGNERAEGMRLRLRALLQESFGEDAPRAELCEDLEALVLEAWHDGRHWVEEVVGDEGDRRIEQFDRRIMKLNRQLAEKEQALERARQSDPGLPSGYRSLQGLSADDLQLSIKRRLLEGILEQNLVLKSS